MEDKGFYLSINGERIRVSKEIYQEYMLYERKERYFTEDLKRERTTVDPMTGKLKVHPSREDSYERLLEKNQQFFSNDKLPEEQLLHMLLLKQLENALHNLSTDELALIYALFYQEQTESQLGKALNISQAAVNKRKSKVLKKLRKMRGFISALLNLDKQQGIFCSS